MQDAYGLGSSCVPFAPEDLFQDVNAPVGAIEGARPSGNQSADVKTVQNLLNQIAPSEGGQQDGSGGLAVDGICGPLTRDAIVTFQKRQFAAFKPDGIVDPTARTINRLNARVPRGRRYSVGEGTSGGGNGRALHLCNDRADAVR